MIDVKPGDRLMIEPNKVGVAARSGTIEEVVATNPPPYRVRWDDGKTSIVSLGGAAVRIERRSG
jgi:hypothetical protein